MIILLDIIIILTITIFSIFKGFKSNLFEELFKLSAFILSMIFSLPLSKILGNFLLNQLEISLETSKEILANDFFYMVSFIFIFTILNYLFFILINRFQESFNRKIKTNQYFNGFFSTFFAMIRSILTITILFYSLKSTLFYSNHLIENLNASPAYRAFISFVNQIF
tara:strand:- start:121 stop:621 length:501 start_codon:yes stop_codon:yes gene_type:complete